jgi:hypothetical protein
MVAVTLRLALVLTVLLAMARVLSPTAAAPVPPDQSGKGDRLPLPLTVDERLPPAMASPRQPATLAAAAPQVMPVAGAPSELEPGTDPVVDPKSRRAHHERDICRGKGRHYTHSGRSWRCNR